MFPDDGLQCNDVYISGGSSVTIEFTMQFRFSSFTSMNLGGAKHLTKLVFRKRNIVGFESQCPSHWQWVAAFE
jgi:hypothetical protein